MALRYMSDTPRHARDNKTELLDISIFCMNGSGLHFCPPGAECNLYGSAVQHALLLTALVGCELDIHVDFS